MALSSSSPDEARWPAPLQGGGVAGELLRSIDWSQTPVGPVERWPASLLNIVGVLLHSRHPMFLWWGPELIQFYNDAYLPSFGKGKHPAAMGGRGRVTWDEIWPIIGPQIEAVMAHGDASWNVDHLVPIWRNGRIEEVYWTYGYSPVFGDRGAIEGTLVVCTETTARVVAERRLENLRALDEGAMRASDPRELQASINAVLTAAGADVAFALYYRTGAESVGGAPALSEAVGVGFDDARRTLEPQVAETLRAVDPRAVQVPIEALTVPGARWPEPVTDVFVVPLMKTAQSELRGYVVFGLSPRLPFDGAYRHHLLQLAEHIDLARARMVVERASHERAKLLTELESANRAKDEFLAMLGHELRNPLSPIVTALHLMRARGDHTTEREQQIIERQAAHLVRLVDDLLDVSKITRGKVVLRKEIGEVHDVIRKAVEIASALFDERAHRLELDLPDERLYWDGDAVRLTQVLTNLLTNAARYTAVGGLIRLSARCEDGVIAIRVVDNGMGISPELLPRIFDPFVQGSRSSDRAEGGLGLGLAVAKNLILLHGGTLEAHSEGPGKGSEFVIRLPAAEPAPAEVDIGATVEDAVAAPAADAKRILLVDDNVDAAELMGEALRFAGHEVTVVNDARAALEAFPKLEPQVAVLDIGLPVMDGHELAARLRTLPSGASCRLIALTGYGRENDKKRSREVGFDHHLVKPVEVDELLQVVTQ